jgi:hypothetical protein
MTSDTKSPHTSPKTQAGLDFNEGYSQREWDRVVGLGEVPDSYRRMTREENQRRYDKG